LVYTSFTDFANASSATLYYMDKTPGFDTYIAAPQVFYFTPQKKWYLIFQSGPPMYSTSDDISDPTKWTRPAAFYSAEPAIIKESGHGWLDYWIICDTSNCHLFFSNTHGRWYKSKTSISSFPSGFGDPVIVMQEAEGGRLYEASNVYKINGSNKYLALVEAYDSTSNWRRYFRSWTAESLEGPWTVLHSFGTAPFAGKQYVSFTGSAWTNDISHGEMIRAGYDEKMAIDACKMQYLYQGFDLNFDTSDWTAYNKIPWHLGLLTQK
jgi:endo-1,4-beta-xylanase